MTWVWELLKCIKLHDLGVLLHGALCGPTFALQHRANLLDSMLPSGGESNDSLSSDIGLDHMMCQRLMGRKGTLCVRNVRKLEILRSNSCVKSKSLGERRIGVGGESTAVLRLVSRYQTCWVKTTQCLFSVSQFPHNATAFIEQNISVSVFRFHALYLLQKLLISFQAENRQHCTMYQN